jgi:NADH-quinone oxidoreductase subunit G
MRGDEVFRVTARKDEWGEIQEASNGKTGWICNECRFEKKHVNDWVIEGPSKIDRHSVIAQGHYVGIKKPHETIEEVMDGSKPRIFLNIHDVSQVNKPGVDLSLIEGPAHSDDFNK